MRPNTEVLTSYLLRDEARQTRLIVSHQPLTQFVCGQVVIIHYSLLYTLDKSMAFQPLKVGGSLLVRQ